MTSSLTDADLIRSLSRLHEAALTAITEAIHVAGRDGADAAIEYLGDWCNDVDAVDEDAIASFDAYIARRQLHADQLAELQGKLDGANACWQRAQTQLDAIRDDEDLPDIIGHAFTSSDRPEFRSRILALLNRHGLVMSVDQ